MISASAGLFHISLISDTLLVVNDNLLSGLRLGFMVNAVVDLLAAQFGSDFLLSQIFFVMQNSSTFLEAMI